MLEPEYRLQPSKRHPAPRRSTGGGSGLVVLPAVFAEGASANRELAGNSAAGTRVGDPLTATESSGKRLTYNHSEEDAALLGIEPKGKMDRNCRVG